MAIFGRNETPLKIDESLLKMAKIHAARTGKSEDQVIEEAFASYIDRKR